MIHRFLVAPLTLAACFVGGAGCFAQSGTELPDAHALNSEMLSVCPIDLSPAGYVRLPHTVGCERFDCCMNCPGPPDWHVHVGPDAEAVYLRFQNLSAAARKTLLIRGDAKWQADGELRLGPGEIVISGLRPDRSGRWPVAFASVAIAKAKFDHLPASRDAHRQSNLPREPRATVFSRLPQPISVAIEQFSGKSMVAATNVSILPNACPSGGHAGPLHASAAVAVVNEASDSVTFYARPVNPNQRGGVPPTREIRGPHTQMTFPTAVAVDGAGRIYVMNSSEEPGSVTIYDRGADGDATPIRSLSSHLIDNIDPEFPSPLAVDDIGEIFARGELLPADEPFDNDEILVFAAGAQGDDAPVQVITDGLHDPNAIAVSRSGDFLYVANSTALGPFGNITIYHRAFGFFSLVDTIPPPQDVNTEWGWESIDVDSFGTIYATRIFIVPPNIVRPSDVVVFQKTNGGPYAQIREFSGYSGDFNKIAVGADGFAYVTESSPTDAALSVFPGNSNGPSQAVARITGATSHLAGPIGVAILP